MKFLFMHYVLVVDSTMLRLVSAHNCIIVIHPQEQEVVLKQSCSLLQFEASNEVKMTHFQHNKLTEQELSNIVACCGV